MNLLEFWLLLCLCMAIFGVWIAWLDGKKPRAPYIADVQRPCGHEDGTLTGRCTCRPMDELAEELR